MIIFAVARRVLLFRLPFLKNGFVVQDGALLDTKF